MKRYRQVLRALRQHCPCAYPVIVRRTKIGDDIDGDCAKNNKQFIIRIQKKLNESQAIDTLMHEWAHARSWTHLHDKLETEEFIRKSHDASWGVAYSEVYRVFEEYFLGLFSEKLS